MLENVYFVVADSTPFIIETVMGKIHFCSDALQCLFPVAPAAGLIVMVYIYIARKFVKFCQQLLLD